MPARRWRLTLRAKVTATTVLILSVAVLVAAMTAAGLLHRALSTDTQSSLDSRIDEVQELIDNQQLTVILDPAGEAVGQVQVVDAAGQVVSVTPGLPVTTRLDVIAAPAVGREAAATVDGTRIDGTPGNDYRVVARTVASTSGPLTIYAVASLATAASAEDHLRTGMFIGLPIVVALAGLLIWWVVGRAFAPVDAMRAEVDRIEATDLSGRVRPGASDSEIARLGATLNRMLDRLQEAGVRQQMFAASASHELRSPLSAIRTELEVGLAYPDRTDWPSVATDSLIEIERLESLTRDLRTLTRSLSTAPHGSQQCDLWTVISEEVGRRERNDRIEYRVQGVTAPIVGEAERILQLVRNLLDNAERHALRVIDVRVETGPSGTRLSVANDGDPVPADRRERIFEPFVRLDEARSLDAGGSGLGLAIARAIVTDVHGTLEAVPRVEGAEFVAWFPPVHGQAGACVG